MISSRVSNYMSRSRFVIERVPIAVSSRLEVLDETRPRPRKVSSRAKHYVENIFYRGDDITVALEMSRYQ